MSTAPETFTAPEGAASNEVSLPPRNKQMVIRIELKGMSKRGDFVVNNPENQTNLRYHCYGRDSIIGLTRYFLPTSVRAFFLNAVRYAAASVPAAFESQLILGVPLGVVSPVMNIE